ncbi:hypothetical protein MANES_18G089349v8 [Manihot esculenta]|uniref:Uncharacterized protein n=1 Tax=Manihot esculenta TaxID=3983 RepID=A0ACB7FZN4_MANES|nr:hypothetical protein MANES_18G089349v8 [Manihot esculenta]
MLTIGDLFGLVLLIFYRLASFGMKGVSRSCFLGLLWLWVVDRWSIDLLECRGSYPLSSSGGLYSFILCWPDRRVYGENFCQLWWYNNVF